MIIRVSPQWQVTIPKAFRRDFGITREAEARMFRGALMLRPILFTSTGRLLERYGQEGITAEVLATALDIVGRRRRAEAEEASGQP
ncbi:hypothetical protein [Paracraurococcus ruber]|uniref:SpoVT-AbrB domain-containing protein n=1 Tax=Paracraurococcus ruber TaxID=77675 RepID=A0ABS1D2J9_9PROT|nr:hypothetical protein [Paracraurococcus ruber]MBK1661062.1 hypothetical protein [Paracraurococcus ruber]TDG30959.1 hypothetical protein E2C05_12460 [Paracraurococcus ruber]